MMAEAPFKKGNINDTHVNRIFIVSSLENDDERLCSAFTSVAFCYLHNVTLRKIETVQALERRVEM